MITNNTEHIKIKDSGSLDIFSNGNRIWGMSSGSGISQMYIGTKTQDNYLQSSASVVNVIVNGNQSAQFTSGSLDVSKLKGSDVYVTKVGGGLHVPTGSNASMGTATTGALPGNVTVNTTYVKSSSKIFLTAIGTHTGQLFADNIVDSTSFRINTTASEAVDVNWLIINLD